MVWVYNYVMSQCEHCLIGTETDFPCIQVTLPALDFQLPNISTSCLKPAYILDCLIHVSLPLSSFIGCPVLCPKPNSFSSLVTMNSSSLLYQLSPSWLSYAFREGGWWWEKLTELRLIKFKNSKLITRLGGNSFCVSLSCFSGGQDLCHIPYTLLSTCWVSLACYLTSLYPSASFLTVHGRSFCFIDGSLRPPGSLLGLGCGSVKVDWQQVILIVHCFFPHYFLSFQKWLFPGGYILRDGM